MKHRNGLKGQAHVLVLIGTVVACTVAVAASVEAAVITNTPAIFVSGEVVRCVALNGGTTPHSVQVSLLSGTDGSVLDDEGPVAIPPGRVAATDAHAVFGDTVYCRFNANSPQVLGNLSVAPNVVGAADRLVIPAR